MKTILAGLLAAAAVAPASAAFVNISWTSGTYSFAGSIDIGSLTGTISESTSGISGWMTASNGGSPMFNASATAISIGDSNFSFTVNGTQTTVAPDGPASWNLSDAAAGNFLAGDVGSPNWAITGDLESTPGVGPDTLALTISATPTVVPEPEHVALAASVGLVAFGLARRRFGKA